MKFLNFVHATARKSLQFFRGNNYDLTEELCEIKLKHESKMKEASNKSWRAPPPNHRGGLSVFEKWAKWGGLPKFDFQGGISR